jgi:hypothetical protein
VYGWIFRVAQDGSALQYAGNKCKNIELIVMYAAMVEFKIWLHKLNFNSNKDSKLKKKFEQISKENL